MSRRAIRKIDYRGEQWTYRIGKSNAVLESPTGERIRLGLDELTGRTPDTIDRGRYKQTPDGMITPGDVRRYLASIRYEKKGDDRQDQSLAR